MDEMMRLSRRLKNLKTTEEKLRQFPAKSDEMTVIVVIWNCCHSYKIGYVLRSVKHIVASATLFPEFKFTHEAGCLGRIGDVIAMVDAQYTPLTATLVRTLTDKLYEKRKAAALDIEKQVRDLVQANHLSQLEKLLAVLKSLTTAQNAHARKGGLIGLAAAAIALGKNTADYTSQLIEPALTCFSDPDPRVRYYACELSADTDLNVRSGAELLDRLLKDIVLATNSFDISTLMSLVRDRIYSQNSSNRRFIVSWISALLTAPELSISLYLPEVLDGLFQMLSDSQSSVRDATETILGQFLERMHEQKDGDGAELNDMINVLIVHACAEGSTLTRMIALIWLNRFLKMHSAGLLQFLSSYLTAVLPCLNDSQLKGFAKEINTHLMELLSENADIEYDAVIKVLLKHIKYEFRDTRMAVLNWISRMHITAPSKLFSYMDRIFPVLLSLLSDTCDDVLLLDLQLLSDICEGKNTSGVELQELNLDEDILKQLSGISPYLVKFTSSLLAMFRSDTALLNDRGVLIVRQLCVLLGSGSIYRCLSILLLKDNDKEFVSQMVALLNGILLTSTELFELRKQLRTLESEVRPFPHQACINLFESLYRTWAFQPIALLGLCILSQNYEHASVLARHLWKVDITVDVLIEIDRLVQLIESPILSYVRLDLLDAKHQRPLTAVLSALLMILPQTDAFNTLHKRIQCIPSVAGKEQSQLDTKVDFKPLLQHFLGILDQQQEMLRRKMLNSTEQGR
ncbi:Protein VAC14-like protein [Dirofilaria immitis]|nr:Protein VAC14-like protein [Dirofilaria immitis]